MHTARIGLLAALWLAGCGTPAKLTPRDLVGTWQLDDPNVRMTWEFRQEANGAQPFRLNLAGFVDASGHWTIDGRKVRLGALQWPATMVFSEWLFRGTTAKDFAAALSDMEVLEATRTTLRVRARQPNGVSEELRFHRR
jgi:hypothetical protein